MTTSSGRDLTGVSILAAFAHPDDEGFGCGGTLAMLVDLGAKVTLVCATNGDVGEISDPSLATPENLHIVRQQELRDAMSVTGIQDIRFLNYRDSGMDGTDDNKHPNSLSQADANQVVDKLADIMHEVKPDAVITHDPSGGASDVLQRRCTSAGGIASPADAGRHHPPAGAGPAALTLQALQRSAAVPVVGPGADVCGPHGMGSCCSLDSGYSWRPSF